MEDFQAMLERQFGDGPAPERSAEPSTLPALLDVAMIEKMTEMLTLEKYRELVAQFFSGKVGRVDELLAAALAGQRDQVRRHSHNLKGAALTLGFSALGGACAGLERLALAEEEGLADEAERVGLLFDSTRSACIAAGYLAGMDLPALR
ncbi:Hpt domain-containing protein [Chromobacterium haemolyticum]|nr:Hpt domain-containing protein [Chromobacterium haemolyticum]